MRLFYLDMKGHAIAAVQYYGLESPTNPIRKLNAGVLVIDCAAYLSEELERRW